MILIVCIALSIKEMNLTCYFKYLNKCIFLFRIISCTYINRCRTTTNYFKCSCTSCTLYKFYNAI